MPSFYIKADNPRWKQVRARCAEQILNTQPGKNGTEIIIKPYKKDRSIEQNRALFGYAYKLLEEHTGMTKNELHYHMCKEFFGIATKSYFCSAREEHVSYEVPVRTTTTDEYGKADVMSTNDFAGFFNMVQNIGAEYGCIIPDPQRME